MSRSVLPALVWIAGCAPVEFPADPAACDPRPMAPGEVRARRIPCSDELIADGEGRVGDWLLESAGARFVIRDTYAAISAHAPGGTLIDAAAFDGEDAIMELIPDGDRSSIAVGSWGSLDPDPAQRGEARLELPGVTYRLAVDSGVLEIEADGGLFAVRPGKIRDGATVWDEGRFTGATGDLEAAPLGGLEDLGGRARIGGPIRVALSPDALWGGEDGAGIPGAARVEGEVDADAVIATAPGPGGDPITVARLPVTDGRFAGWLPAGVGLTGAREGCAYDGLALIGCASMRLRLTATGSAGDPSAATAEDVPGVVRDGAGGAWIVPPGGGVVPLGPIPRRLTVEAGPGFTRAGLDWSGADGQGYTVTLARAVTAEAVGGDPAAVRALMAAAEVAPDPDTDIGGFAALGLLGARHVDFAVLLADDEIPGVPDLSRGRPVAVAGSRAAGGVLSWPWAVNQKRPAHGAPDAADLAPLDLLAAAAGRAGDERITVVSRDWLEEALGGPGGDLPSGWSPAPTALLLTSADDLDLAVPLWQAGLDPALIGPWTWLDIGLDRNPPAFERAIWQGLTTAGSGPALSARASPRLVDGQILVYAEVEAAREQDIRELSVLYGLDGLTYTLAQPVAPDRSGHGAIPASGNLRASAVFLLPAGAEWVSARATGPGGWAARSAIRLR